MSESDDPAPTRITPCDDTTRADAALRAIRAGCHLLYRGDERNARQLLAALTRRIRREGSPAPARGGVAAAPAERFRALRESRLREHQLLSHLLVEIGPSYELRLARASDVAAACAAAWGAPDGTPRLTALRELLGILGAFEWTLRGIEIPALGARIHPHYGVFAPTRRATVELVAEALAEVPLAGRRVFDIGTGSGVLALLAAKRGAREVMATDLDPRAVACARENALRLGLSDRVRVLECDLYPEGRADLVLANPPWLPAEPRTRLDRAVYDPDSNFLARWLAGLREHLVANGQGWLLISDLPERLELRPRGFLLDTARAAGLELLQLRERRAEPALRAQPGDPIAPERAEERIQLFQFGTKH
jgi:SAM-dependent methyltransferase